MAEKKMSVKDQVTVRSHLYEVALNAIVQDGKETEVIADGALIHLGDGQFAKMKISICDATKFDLEDTRAKYQEKLAKQAEMAEKRAEAMRIKAEKAEKKAKKEENSAS